MARTVWILGAGFSRSLGGPLLNELLTSASQARVRAAFPPGQGNERLVNDQNARMVLDLFRVHGPSSEVAERHWGDAEAFLETLDAAAHEARLEKTTDPATRYLSAPSARLILRLARSLAISNGQRDLWHSIDSGDYSLPALACSARRLIAAECSAFLRNADPKTSEKWGPYRRWAQQLASGDTVVTFNYDRTVETSAAAVEQSAIVQVVPGSWAGVDVPVPLLKLHGSVDWKCATDGSYSQERAEFVLNSADDEMVIGSPGPTKKAVRNALNPLWLEAHKRIAEADVVVFVGYRFPPSDSEARRFIVDALVTNRARFLTLRTVLGANSPDAARLAAILEYAMAARTRRHGIEFPRDEVRRHQLRAHPLGAEDFLDLYDPECLDKPNF